MDSNNAMKAALRDKPIKTGAEVNPTAWEMKTFYAAARENLNNEVFTFLIEQAKIKVGV